MPITPLTVTVGATTCPLTAPPVTPFAVLDFVYALLVDPARWHQGSAACDVTGKTVDACCSTAVRWGLEGAIYRAISADGIEPEASGVSGFEWRRCTRLTKMVFELFDVPVDRFNDVATHRLVIGEVRLARARARVLRRLTKRRNSGEMVNGARLGIAYP